LVFFFSALRWALSSRTFHKCDVVCEIGVQPRVFETALENRPYACLPIWELSPQKPFVHQKWQRDPRRPGFPELDARFCMCTRIHLRLTSLVACGGGPLHKVELLDQCEKTWSFCGREKDHFLAWRLSGSRQRHVPIVRSRSTLMIGMVCMMSLFACGHCKHSACAE
jgi:hypothetical protein